MDFLFTKVAYAASRRFDEFLTNVNTLIINPLIILLFALAMVYFLYGVFEFLANSENEEKKTAGKQHMIWGVVGLTLMMGVWAILGLIMNTFSIEGINLEEGKVVLPPYNPTLPQVR